ncbi:hypothetical protein SNOG_12192 [Parastagonospora nodorum SN15]|uniref:Bromo domain-containing protein n=1 Tax=Phaeosphaeria nodorum (strain SN15 / ATCC MYA-4574 / FGSC 10173) TaxID=321614 RepID=Q0U7S2_PHANO|nr:hypothetical protein SNOG_12192 [Parastagonospora nodorum SN15]EAT80604.2 hypothetical protein SNOG_12192 [Parastagonospora nodorum SN15]
MSLAASTHRPSSRERPSHARFLHQPPNPMRLRTPNATLSDEAMSNGSNANNLGEGADTTAEEDPRAARWHDQYLRTEARLSALLGGARGDDLLDALDNGPKPSSDDAPAAHDALPTVTPKKAARAIDEDDYGDDDDDEEEDDTRTSPLLSRSAPNGIAATALGTPSIRKPSVPNRMGTERTSTPSSEQTKTSDDVRKKLQQVKKAAEDAAKRSFNTLFYTLESDQTSGPSNNAPTSGAVAAPQQGTLSTTNLGASSLTLKHLISRIDAQRDRVHATDAQLRSLISEVRKNRSKWANEDRVGQEELYESVEKVLMELKAGEHAHPFLQRVNKREAPDYYNVIKQPMDIGTMMKKLKQLQYKSKKEFVDDLMLILVQLGKPRNLWPLIPDITIRDRAEVEAEERRMRNGDVDADGAEDSEDEEPIMASRGRKAPSKGGKGSSNARKAPPAGLEGTPGPETKPSVPSLNSAVSNLKNEISACRLRDGGNGVHGSQADLSEIDGTSASVNGFALEEEADLDDLEYKTWKQVTKKDRATIAAERHRLFRDDKLQPEEPCYPTNESGDAPLACDTTARMVFQATAKESLAEGIEGEDERQIPDYYDAVCTIPDLNERLQWVKDADGQVVQQFEEYMRIFPQGQFTAPDSGLAKKMQANMQSLQDTRKICAKIGIVKQMQLQSQLYQNQFQRYEPQPFMETDIDPMVVSEEGALMAPMVCRAALQRSVGKIFYHAGFEEFQPSALDAVTDIAAKFFQNLVASLGIYRETPKMKSDVPITLPSGKMTNWAPRFTQEEAVLHALHANGVDLETLETYVKDDVERLGTKLSGMHDRMRSYYAELLRPALDNAGQDGAGAFNDGSEQFVGGDFAEDIGEDFFGFKELGLDREFGLTFSVPLHLLQNRVHSAYARQDNKYVSLFIDTRVNANFFSNASTAGVVMPEPPKFEPVTIESVESQIGLIQSWLFSKLHANDSQPLVEDDDLPLKQRFPKPRLPPTGKISSPRKRPLREQQQMARKKRKLEEEKGDTGHDGNLVRGIGKPIGKLKLEPSQKENSNMLDPEKDDASAHGMPSPPESF